jgi:hypothetical protein
MKLLLYPLRYTVPLFPGNNYINKSHYYLIKKLKLKIGIQLDKTKIEKNPGMRVVSKLLANTLWYF